MVYYNVGKAVTNAKVRGAGPTFKESEGPEPLVPSVSTPMHIAKMNVDFLA